MKGSLWRWIVGNTQFDPLWLFRNSLKLCRITAHSAIVNANQTLHRQNWFLGITRATKYEKITDYVIAVFGNGLFFHRGIFG
jgi:hypothetical protein